MTSNTRRRSAERERIQKVERSSFACVVGHTDREGALPIKATRAKLSYPCVCACLWWFGWSRKIIGCRQRDVYPSDVEQVDDNNDNQTKKANEQSQKMSTSVRWSCVPTFGSVAATPAPNWRWSGAQVSSASRAPRRRHLKVWRVDNGLRLPCLVWCRTSTERERERPLVKASARATLLPVNICIPLARAATLRWNPQRALFQIAPFPHFHLVNLLIASNWAATFHWQKKWQSPHTLFNLNTWTHFFHLIWSNSNDRQATIPCFTCWTGQWLHFVMKLHW